MPVRLRQPNAYECEDVISAGQMFEAVGVALSSEEMYGVALQVKRLGQDPKLKLKAIRFFGKFFGLHGDYYVFQATPTTTPAFAAETQEGLFHYQQRFAFKPMHRLGHPGKCLFLLSKTILTG